MVYHHLSVSVLYRVHIMLIESSAEGYPSLQIQALNDTGGEAWAGYTTMARWPLFRVFIVIMPAYMALVRMFDTL